MFITNLPLLQRLSCGLCFKQPTDSQIQIYFHTVFFLVKNNFGKHKQTQTDVCFFLFYLCCSPSSASRAKNTLFFPKRVLFLKTDNFQMICVVDKTCWLRTWVWCTAGEYAGPCLTHRASRRTQRLPGSPGRRAMLSVCPSSGALTQVRWELLPLPHAALSPSVQRMHLYYVWQCGPEDE